MCRKISHIYKCLYVSGCPESCELFKLNQYNIKAILHLGIEPKSESTIAKYTANGIDHKFIQVPDKSCNDIISVCESQCFDYIDSFTRKNQNILVHCRMGVSRSPTVVAHFLMRHMFEYMRYKKEVRPVMDDILQLIRNSRPCANPNKGFMRQLKKYENNNLGIGVNTNQLRRHI